MNNYRVPLLSLSVILVELWFGMRLKELPEFSKAPGERQLVDNGSSCILVQIGTTRTGSA
jgi:hypothetical protein